MPLPSVTIPIVESTQAIRRPIGNILSMPPAHQLSSTQLQDAYYTNLAKFLGLHTKPLECVYFGSGADLRCVLNLSNAERVLAIERQEVNPEKLAEWIASSDLHKEIPSPKNFGWQYSWQGRLETGYWRTPVMENFGIERCLAAELESIQACDIRVSSKEGAGTILQFTSPDSDDHPTIREFRYQRGLYDFLNPPCPPEAPQVFLVKSCDGYTGKNSLYWEGIVKALAPASLLIVGQPHVDPPKCYFEMQRLQEQLQTLACEPIEIPYDMRKEMVERTRETASFDEYGWGLRVFRKK